MRISLIKSAVDPDYCADLGNHIFTYAILPHSSEWYEAHLEQEAFDLNNPIIPFNGTCQVLKDSMFRFNQENIEVDCIKMAEYSDHIIVRFHEFMGKRTQLMIESSMPIDTWYECNLMEQPIEEGKHSDISMEITPYEIKTIAIALK